MEKKNFGGLEVDLVSLWDHNYFTSFATRNPNAATVVRLFGQTESVMRQLAEASQAFIDDASVEIILLGRAKLHLAMVREEVDTAGVMGKAQVGLYALPREMRIEASCEDSERVEAWASSSNESINKARHGLAILWTSVSQPRSELKSGRFVYVDQLDNGDYIGVVFAGFRGRKPRFEFCIDTAEEAARLGDSDRRAA